MNQADVTGFDFSMVTPAFMAGLGDSLNPCNFTTLLIFITILSRIAHTPSRVFLFGGLFMVLAGGVHYLSLMGSWDGLLSLPIALNVIRFGYLLIAATFLFLGIAHISDWWRYKKNVNTNGFKIQLPVFLNDKTTGSPVSLLKKIFIGTMQIGMLSLAAIIIPLVGTIYPQSEYVFIVHSFFMAGGDKELVKQSFGLYCFAMILPLMITWLAIWILTLGKKRGAKVISYYKGILSALYIATGIGLGYFFLN